MKRIRLVGVNRTTGSVPWAASSRTVQIDTSSSSATSRVVKSFFGTLSVTATRLVSAEPRRTLAVVGLDEIRARLTAEQEDVPGYLTPERASDWAALTDDELFRLRRKIEHENHWHYSTRLENELTTRLIQALSALRVSSDRASRRLNLLTVVLVLLTVIIAVFTVVTAVKS